MGGGSIGDRGADVDIASALAGIWAASCLALSSASREEGGGGLASVQGASLLLGGSCRSHVLVEMGMVCVNNLGLG